MEVLQIDNGENGKFYINIANKELAEMAYVWAGLYRMIIDHTGVDDRLHGKGTGKLKVMKAVEFAREKGNKIIPLCPFAKSVFDKVKEIQVVL